RQVVDRVVQVGDGRLEAVLDGTQGATLRVDVLQRGVQLGQRAVGGALAQAAQVDRGGVQREGGGAGGGGGVGVLRVQGDVVGAGNARFDVEALGLQVADF